MGNTFSVSSISRVRLRSREELNPFETLIGGLSWCIGYIKPEFNRDIAYSEGMSLGKKIAISENIIKCLIQYLYFPARIAVLLAGNTYTR